MPRHVIVSKDHTLKSGQVYKGLHTDPLGESRPEQCFLVVGPSNEKSWIEYLVAITGEGMRDHYEMVAEINGPWYYYEIETD